MIRKHKRYAKPRKSFDAIRMKEENSIVGAYGLKKKREIWKAEAQISRIRKLAKGIITKDEEEKRELIIKLNKQGFKVSSIADILALNKEDWLKRRLQTLVYEKKLARGPREARQLIIHKHISVGDKIVNVPSYIVGLGEENKISLKGLKQPGLERKDE